MRSIINGFTRQEVLGLLPELTSSKLSYLDRINLIVPKKIPPKSKKPICIYSWEQLLELKAICNLRESVSLQTIQKISKYLVENGFSDSYRDKSLVVTGGEVYWIMASEYGSQLPKILALAKEQGQYALILPSVQEMATDVWETQEKIKPVDQKRFEELATIKPKIKVA